MNTEQKAKAYDEALKQVKKELAACGSMNCDAARLIFRLFPQLRESEDERIRKALIQEFKEKVQKSFEWKDGIPNNAVLAWLEKQKEQKPVEKKIALNGFEKALDSFLFDFAHSSITDCEPKEYIKNHSTYLIKAAYKELNAQLKQDLFEAQQEGRREGYEAAKNELKPTEWSEEDEKLFWGFTAYIPEEELKRLGVTRNDILMKLKSLRSNPIQLKEAYIDGFDTARHATALAFMNYCDKIRPNGKMCLSNGECEDIEKAFLVGDWEKIERYFHKYHWKPSEDEERLIKTSISFLKDFADKGYENAVECIDWLKSKLNGNSC